MVAAFQTVPATLHRIRVASATSATQLVVAHAMARPARTAFSAIPLAQTRTSKMGHVYYRAGMGTTQIHLVSAISVTRLASTALDLEAQTVPRAPQMLVQKAPARQHFIRCLMKTAA